MKLFLLALLAPLLFTSCRTRSDTEMHLYLDYGTGVVYGHITVDGVAHPVEIHGTQP